jgi:hypothetical protein
MVLLMYQATQQIYNEQINTTILVFIYYVEVLLDVSTQSGHHEAVITLIVGLLTDRDPDPMLGGSFVTTAWHVLRLWMEETPSSFGGQLRIY